MANILEQRVSDDPIDILVVWPRGNEGQYSELDVL